MSKKYRALFLKPSTLNFSGFTLLELLVVLAIMALLTGMSVPAISGYLRGARLRGGAREIASTLRHARQLAITKRAIYSVDLIAATNQFYVNDGINVVGEIRTLPETICFHSATTTYTYDFTARGTVDAGSVYIVDPRGTRKRIAIVAATRRVRIE